MRITVHPTPSAPCTSESGTAASRRQSQRQHEAKQLRVGTNRKLVGKVGFDAELLLLPLQFHRLHAGAELLMQVKYLLLRKNLLISSLFSFRMLVIKSAGLQETSARDFAWRSRTGGKRKRRNGCSGYPHSHMITLLFLRIDVLYQRDV